MEQTKKIKMIEKITDGLLSQSTYEIPKIARLVRGPGKCYWMKEQTGG